MAAKTKTDKIEGDKAAEKAAPTDFRLVMGQQITDETAQREAKQAAVKVTASKVKPDADGDIDQRMAALHADHVAMGARPK